MGNKKPGGNPRHSRLKKNAGEVGSLLVFAVRPAASFHPTLLLVKGEFDSMLAWQYVHHLCDVATLGSGFMRPRRLDIAHFTRFQRILAIFDNDPAGDRARAYFHRIPRIQLITPPAHDLTDYYLSGGDLRTWLTSLLTS